MLLMTCGIGLLFISFLIMAKSDIYNKAQRLFLRMFFEFITFCSGIVLMIYGIKAIL